MDEMETKDFTIEFESQLVSTSMTMNGGHKITLRINPHDVADSDRVRTLMTQSPNTRYMCVLVQLGEETDEPVPALDSVEGQKAVSLAAMLCRNNYDFQRWIIHRYPHLAEVHGTEPSEETASSILKKVLGIYSRSELKTNETARGQFEKLKKAFDNE